MASKQKEIGLLIDNDTCQALHNMSSELRAEVMKAVLGEHLNEMYDTFGLSEVAQTHLIHIIPKIQRNKKNYEQKCEINKRNGEMGGRPKKKESEGL